MKNRLDMRIYLDDYDADRTIPHTLYNIVDFVTQYRFQGGPEQPLRYLEMKVDKNNIDDSYPELMHSVVEGKTRLLVDAVGKGTFIITKLWLTDNEYDIVATGIEITLNTATLEDDIEEGDPPDIVKDIFDDWVDSLNLTQNGNYTIVGGEPGDTYEDDFQIYFSSSVSNTRTSPGSKISFKENMPTLVAINMCSLMDDAFVFFDDLNGSNTMYYVHYGDDLPLASNPGDASMDGVVNIYPRMTSQYQTYTTFDLMMFKKLIGVSSKNSEGSETIVNNQIVVMNGGKGEALSQDSFDMYGDYAGTKVSSDLMTSYSFIYTNPYTTTQSQTNTAQLIADNLVKRYKDPTRSITVTLSEVISNDNGSGWEQAIPTYTYANKILDNVNNISINTQHLCDDTIDPFMLRLSTFIRAYPEFTTEYTFGVMKETTLSQELANKLTGMTGNVTDIRHSVGGTSFVSDLGIVEVDDVPSNNPNHLITSKAVYDYTSGAKVQDVQFNGSSVANNGIVTVEGIIDILYPIGSIYTSVNSANPSTLFHIGTWVAFGQGRVLVGQDPNDSDFSTAEATGGEKTHTLTTDEMPSHTHDMKKSQFNTWSYNNSFSSADAFHDFTNNVSSGGNHYHEILATGGDQPHNNLQPYIVVYMWKRTA